MNQSLPAEAISSRKLSLRAAFTLVELLVVIAIVAILAGLLLPALAKTKAQAQGAFCQNNIRQLMLACLTYCDDNAGYFPYNMAGAAVHTNINWASDVLDWETTPDNTNTALLNNAALGPYVARASAVYHCPADTALSAVQRSAGWPQRARSYSINASIGNAGDLTKSGVNTNNPNYIQFFKNSSVPQPAQIFVLIEEHPDTISDGYFLNKAYPHQWIRLPASYHNGCANISFADGHAESHPWQDSLTKPPAAPDAATASLFTTLPADQQDDFNWVIAHMTVRTH